MLPDGNSVNDVILITGASGEIGSRCALSFARPGVTLILHYHDSVSRIKRLQSDINARGAVSFPVSADLTRPEEIESMFGEIRSRVKYLNVVVNNAGADFAPSNWKTIDDETFLKTIHLNLVGTFNVTRSSYGLLKKAPWGRIVNIASRSAIYNSLVSPAYSCSKSGIIALTRGFAQEFARDRITVNCLLPSRVLTRRYLDKGPGFITRISRTIPFGRMAEIGDVTDAIRFLAARTTGYITGQMIIIDGGSSLFEQL